MGFRYEDRFRRNDSQASGANWRWLPQVVKIEIGQGKNEGIYG